MFHRCTHAVIDHQLCFQPCLGCGCFPRLRLSDSSGQAFISLPLLTSDLLSLSPPLRWQPDNGGVRNYTLSPSPPPPPLLPLPLPMCVYNNYIIHVHCICADGCFFSAYTHYMYMINTQTLEKNKGKIYKSNPKATTFQRKIAASGGT